MHSPYWIDCQVAPPCMVWTLRTMSLTSDPGSYQINCRPYVPITWLLTNRRRVTSVALSPLNWTDVFVLCPLSSPLRTCKWSSQHGAGTREAWGVVRGRRRRRDVGGSSCGGFWSRVWLRSRVDWWVGVPLVLSISSPRASMGQFGLEACCCAGLWRGPPQVC